MSTLDTGHHITPSDPITARMSAGEWWKVISLIVGTAITGAIYVTNMQGSIADATREAKDAARDAAKALDQSNAVKAELQGALVALSSKLGRIEGLLERLTQEPRK
jgi:hypothetical protein